MSNTTSKNLIHLYFAIDSPQRISRDTELVLSEFLYYIIYTITFSLSLETYPKDISTFPLIR